MEFSYQPGFHNDFSTEAVPGALPIGRNSPQKPPLGLYPEQINGTAFTAPRSDNLRSWTYRIQPTVTHRMFEKTKFDKIKSAPFTDVPPTPNQLRWDPIDIPKTPTDFLDGLVTIAGNGDVGTQVGSAIHLYACNKSMDQYFYSADGEFLFVPQLGTLYLLTEFGKLEVSPLEIAVIPRGIKFQVLLKENEARGYVLENYGASFRLPNLGPIGANGLANPRDFLAPKAWYEEKKGNFLVIAKFQGEFYECPIDHSPLDVVAWHGNYYPYKYDLTKFNTINTVSFDHPDPSIFTVLTSPTSDPGVANIDFVIFPPRFMVAKDTFRPPYFHRNFMNEFMGLVTGAYDAKEEGFLPGGCSQHNCMSGHGPDAETFEKATNAELIPHYMDSTMAFMFESRYAFRNTKFGLETKYLQKDYYQCWQGLKPRFKK